MSSLIDKGINESENQETTLVKTVNGREIEADLVVRVLGQVSMKPFVDWLILLLHRFSLLYNRTGCTTDSFSARVRYLTPPSSIPWIRTLSTPRVEWSGYHIPCKFWRLEKRIPFSMKAI